MKIFNKGIGGALLSLAFVFGIVGIMGGTAEAQNRRSDGTYQRRDHDGDRDDRNRSSRRRRHRDDRDNDSWRRNRDNNGRYGYGRNGNNGRGVGGYGNNGRYGNNGGYGNNGRYGNYGGYGNNGGYNQVEMNRGYQQGIETGSSDGQRGQSYNPQRSRHFKNASSQVFRQGFVQGYDQGYRQYSGYGNQRNGTNNGGWGNVLGGVFGRP